MSCLFRTLYDIGSPHLGALSNVCVMAIPLDPLRYPFTKAGQVGVSFVFDVFSECLFSYVP